SRDQNAISGTSAAKCASIAGNAGEIIAPARTVRLLATSSVILSRVFSGLWCRTASAASVVWVCPIMFFPSVPCSLNLSGGHKGFYYVLSQMNPDIRPVENNPVGVIVGQAPCGRWVQGGQIIYPESLCDQYHCHLRLLFRPSGGESVRWPTALL